jgi:hypothetical protein
MLNIEKKQQQEDYLNFLTKINNSLIYYGLNYLKFIEKITNSQLIILVGYEGDHIVSSLAYFVKKSKFGNVINSGAYFGSHGGPLGVSQKACSDILEYSRITENIDTIISTTIISNPFIGFSYKENFSHLSMVEERTLQLSKIPTHSNKFKESLFVQVHPKTRNILKKSLSFKIRLSLESSEVSKLFNLHKTTSIEQKRKYKNKIFFDEIFNFFQYDQDFIILTAYDEKNELLGSLLLFFYKDFVEYFIPAQNANGRKSQIMTRLIYEGFEIASKRGLLFWNWGGTGLDQLSLKHFKKRWGAKDYNYNYYHQNKIEKTLNVNVLKKELADFYVFPYTQTRMPN